MDKYIKYLVVPGKVTSITDGDEHFISAERLMELYKVDPKECKVINSEYDTYGLPKIDYVILRPRKDGNYQLKK